MCSEIDRLVDEFRWTLACEPSVYSYFGHRRVLVVAVVVVVVLVVAVVVGLVVVVAAAAATDPNRPKCGEAPQTLEHWLDCRGTLQADWGNFH